MRVHTLGDEKGINLGSMGGFLILQNYVESVDKRPNLIHHHETKFDFKLMPFNFWSLFCNHAENS